MVFAFNFKEGFLTVTLQEAVTPLTEAVIVVVPAFLGEIVPSLSTFAILGLEDFHVIVPVGVAEAFSFLVSLVYRDNVFLSREIVFFTVIVQEAEIVIGPASVLKVQKAVIIAEPALCAVTTPVEVIEAISEWSESQVIELEEPVLVVNCKVSPAVRE